MTADNRENLRETYYCDFNHPSIRELSRKFDTENPDVILEIFRHVRDSYALCAGEPRARASETAECGYGTCWNKALLMVALLRACSIPCRLIKYRLKRDFLKPLLGYDYLLLNNPYNHFAVQAWTGSRWLCADPSLDSRAFKKLYGPLHLPWTIEWDGKNDHVIHTNKSTGPFEIVEDIDVEINKGAGNRPAPSFLLPFMNRRYWKKSGWDTVFLDR